MLAPIAWRTPPRHYGPWELVTSLLTEGLVAQGVEVTLFATLDSITSAQLSGVSPVGYAEADDMDGRIWEALHVSHALARSHEFDLLHNQMDWLPLAFDRQAGAPMVTTSSSTRTPSWPGCAPRAGLLAAGARRLARHPPRPRRGRDARRRHVHGRRPALLDRPGRRPQHAEPRRRRPRPPPRAVRRSVPPHRRPRALRPGRATKPTA